MDRVPKVTFVLPWPPSVNTYWRVVNGRPIISLEGREYRRRVIAELRQTGAVKAEGRLAVSVVACPPDQRRRDLDNLFKGLLDALAHAGVYEDDSQIDDLRITRGKQVKGGSMVVTVEGYQP